MRITDLPLDETSRVDLRQVIEEAAQASGLVTTHITTLAKYPGCIHWHFKHGKGSGTLEATYWPDQKRAWLSYRSGREADWIAPAIQRMKRIVEKRVKSR
jgi:hypothetical protein